MTFHWRYGPATGVVGPRSDGMPGGLSADQPFVSQSDAESWLGENWRELAEAGVVEVTLIERDAHADRDLYEMSLLAD